MEQPVVANLLPHLKLPVGLDGEELLLIADRNGGDMVNGPEFVTRRQRSSLMEPLERLLTEPLESS